MRPSAHRWPVGATRSRSSRTTPRSPSCSTCSGGSARLGSSTLVPWRNLRGLFAPLRRNEILGLLVDWGYRSDGIPVRLFDAWTTLPAGPAVLAAKTGATIAPLAIRRIGDGRYRIEPHGEFTVPSSDPADIQRATQRIADALRGRRSPPLPSSGTASSRCGPTIPPRRERSRAVPGTRTRRLPPPPRSRRRDRHGGHGAAAPGRGFGSRPRDLASCRAPRLARDGRGGARRRGCPRPRWSRPPSPRASCGTGSPPRAATRRAPTWLACARASPRPTAAAPPSGARPPTPTPSSASCAPPSATRPATTSRWPGPGRTTSRPRWRGWTSTTRTASARRSSTAARSSSSACTTAPSSCRS